MNHQLDAANLHETHGTPVLGKFPGRTLTITVAAVVALAAVAVLVTMEAEFVGSATQAEHQAASLSRPAGSVHVVVVPGRDMTFHERYDLSLKQADGEGVVAPTF